MQARAQTLQQRFGFQDHELSTPLHDDLMLWLDSWIMLGKLVSDWTTVVIYDWDMGTYITEDEPLAAQENTDGWMGNWIKRIDGRLRDTSCHKTQYSHRAATGIKEFLASRGDVDLPPFPGVKINAKKWEMPIVDKTYTIGFVDMAVSIDMPCLAWHKTEDVMQIPPDGIGHLWDTGRLYFEVKPSIPSVGEVVRQIRMYQTYTNGHWYIVSPDDRWKNVLADQGIGFVKAEI